MKFCSLYPTIFIFGHKYTNYLCFVSLIIHFGLLFTLFTSVHLVKLPFSITFFKEFLFFTVDVEYINVHLLSLMQNKKEYAYNQSYARTSAVLPDMGQTGKERGESLEWALMFMLPIWISCWIISNGIYPYSNQYFFLLISISSPGVWITKINKCISETFFFSSFFIPTGQQRFAVIGDSSRAGSYYIPSNIAHGIVVGRWEMEGYEHFLALRFWPYGQSVLGFPPVSFVFLPHTFSFFK